MLKKQKETFQEAVLMLCVSARKKRGVDYRRPEHSVAAREVREDH